MANDPLQSLRDAINILGKQVKDNIPTFDLERGRQRREDLGSNVRDLARSTTLPAYQVQSGLAQPLGNLFIDPNKPDYLPSSGVGLLFTKGDREVSRNAPKLNKDYDPEKTKKFERKFDYPLTPPISPNPAFGEVSKEVLENFTPLAKFAIESTPVGKIDKKAGTIKGMAFKGPFGTGAMAVSDPPAREVVLHEYLHRSARGLGGIDTKRFLEDFNEKLSKEHPSVYLSVLRNLNGSPSYNGISSDNQAEEAFAFVGARLGSGVFNTSMGKYYKGILKENSDIPSYSTHAYPSTGKNEMGADW